MKFLSSLFIGGILLATAVFVYQQYGDDFVSIFQAPETLYSVYVDTVVLSVSIADTDKERVQGLSGAKELADLEGKLFVFDDEQKHGIWMKDMQFPIDVLWFNNNLELVHIEENVDPGTYPTVFIPNRSARFVLEVNSNLVSALHMQYGDRLILPSSILPVDIRDSLQ